MTPERYQDRIMRDPSVMAGKPVVKGTRIPVEVVLRHLEENPDLQDLLAAFPRLTKEDIKACLAYARAAVEAGRPAQTRRKAIGPRMARV
ncbi:MAG: DUF433 domain-containing protein [Chloroflexi bacterium]|nr:DUF433 domain-containing protein [Chloroflexota bacterium]